MKRQQTLVLRMVMEHANAQPPKLGIDLTRRLRWLRSALAVCLCCATMLPASPAFSATFDGEYVLLDAGRKTRVGELEFAECRLSNLGGSVQVVAECATFSVPEDPAAPSGAAIELFVARLVSSNAKPQADPLLAIAGGPGQAASLAFIGSGAFSKVREARHVYLLDQRGTGFSSPLPCQAPTADTDRSPAAARATAGDCLKQLDRDPRHYTTSAAVRDLEALRQALAAPALNLLGVSYGTRVAQHYARRYHSTTRSLILDGVVPPDLALGPDIAAVSQHALDRLLDRCEAEPGCHAAYPSLRREAQALLAGQVAGPLAPEEIAATVQMTLYQAAGLSLLPLMLHKAAAGDFGPLATHHRRLAEAQGTALNFAMANSVICSEDLPFVAWEQVDMATLEASFLGTRQLEQLRAVCERWPRGAVDPDLRTPLASDVPALLLSGEFDPVTPADYARRAAAQLSRAQVLEVPGQAHNTLDAGCVPELLASFLEQPRQALDTECLKRAWQPPFFLSPNGPGP